MTTTTSFKGICFSVSFFSPTKKKTTKLHAAELNCYYSSTLQVADLGPVFKDSKKTQVVDNINDVLSDLIIKHIIIPFADQTDNPTKTIPPLLGQCPLSCSFKGGEHQPLTVTSLEDVLWKCVSKNHYNVNIFINSSNLHFDTSSWLAYCDWSKISLAQHAPLPPTTAPLIPQNCPSNNESTTSTTGSSTITSTPTPSNNGPNPNKTSTPTKFSQDRLLEQPPTSPSSLSKIPTSIPHTFANPPTNSFAIPPGEFLIATKLDNEVAASPLSFHKAPDIDTLADDDPVAKYSTIPFTTPPTDCSIPPKNTKLHPHKDVTTASPIVTLADNDPTFLNQGSVSSYVDPLSIAPEISSLADDNPYQRRICACDDPFSTALLLLSFLPMTIRPA